jgi:hypothetical protein
MRIFTDRLANFHSPAPVPASAIDLPRCMQEVTTRHNVRRISTPLETLICMLCFPPLAPLEIYYARSEPLGTAAVFVRHEIVAQLKR